MKKYKPVDVLYEDIYDFDDINGKSFDFDKPRPGKTYTVDKYGEIVRPVNKHRGADDFTVRLPPVAGAKSLVPQPPTARHGSDTRHKRNLVGHRETDVDLDHGRHTQYVVSQPNKEQKSKMTDREAVQPSQLPAIDHDVLYRSLMESVHDKSMLEKSPQVLEYERRNNIKHEGCKRGLSEKIAYKTTQAGDTFMERAREFEEPVVDGTHRGANTQEPSHQPAPPTAPKPEPSKPVYNIHRRRLRYANTDLDQDVSLHNPPKPYYKPTPPTAEVDIDFDSEIKEALRVERELDLLHKEIDKQKKANMVYGMEILPPSTASAANSNHPGRSTPCMIPTAAVPYKSAEPVKTWNGDSAKRGLGFKSKIKKEKKETRKIDINLIPDKIRKEMKKYFS